MDIIDLNCFEQKGKERREVWRKLDFFFFFFSDT